MRWIVVFVHVHLAELDVIRLRSDHFNNGGTLHESKGKFVCVWRWGGVKTTRTLVKGTAGAAESGIGKVFFFFFFNRAIKEPWTHIDKLPPTEVVSCSALASREVK